MPAGGVGRVHRLGPRRGPRPRSGAGRRLIALALIVASVLVVAACERPRFRYDRASHHVYAAVKPRDVVVIGPQASTKADRNAVRWVHARGAKAFRYQQWYWQPNGRVYQGVDISANPGWALCTRGTAPLIDTVQHPGQLWSYLDLNERGLRDAQVVHLRHLREIGYDGIFIDRGAAALTGDYSQTVSTCTSHPVVPGRSVARAYLGMMNQARALGFTLALNGGPLDLLNKRAVGVDAMATASYVLDESGAKRGVPAMLRNAYVAVQRGVEAWVMVRPGPENAIHRSNAEQVPSVKVVHGVRAAEDVP